jgi:hypothetical protein
MEIDRKTLEQLITAMMEFLKNAETEITAHKVVITALEKEAKINLQQQLNVARESLRDGMNKKYAHQVEKLLAAFGQAAQTKALEELLRTWIPPGKPN